MRQSRSWAKPNQRIVFPYDNTRFKGVTLFGAIGTGLVAPFFMLAEKTSADETERFLLSLTAHLKPRAVG